VKRSLLHLRLLYQFFDPIEHSLIGNSGRHTLVMLDLAVEFDAPVTHSIPPFFRQRETTSHFTTIERQFCFNAPRSFGSGSLLTLRRTRIGPAALPAGDRHLHNLRRDTGPEIMITVVVHVPAEVPMLFWRDPSRWRATP
jgi:hypothetical protein